MTALLDDGRHVAFDIKDYAAIDHGYAATIHKAQGVTVDRVHVLATPGLDRHAAYVALSRHRDGVDLHYGQDDFADRSRLVAALARERAKDMASDYDRDPRVTPGQAFAERRSIWLPAEPARRAPTIEPRQAMPVRDPATGVSRLDAAVTRHGRIVQAMLFSQSIAEPYTPEQRSELAASRAALRAFHPEAHRDLETAFGHDRGLVREAANGRTARVIQAMQLEADMRSDPRLRADVFVNRWQALERQRRSLLEDHETTRAGKVADRMLGLAKGLERDPQVDSLLRSRRLELGLKAERGPSIAAGLEQIVGRWRGRGLGR